MTHVTPVEESPVPESDAQKTERDPRALAIRGFEIHEGPPRRRKDRRDVVSQLHSALEATRLRGAESIAAAAHLSRTHLLLAELGLGTIALTLDWRSLPLGGPGNDGIDDFGSRSMHCGPQRSRLQQ
jgi:hypothetical protein